MAAADLLAVELMTHDLVPVDGDRCRPQPAQCPRLDNPVNRYAGMEALLASAPHDCLLVMALFDHERLARPQTVVRSQTC